MIALHRSLAAIVASVACLAGTALAGPGVPGPATPMPFVPPANAAPAPRGRLAVLPPSVSSVDVITLKGVISPIALDQVEDAVGRATAARRTALVIELDTPGGLDASMRSIVQVMLASPVPILVYVAPTGARAASAGLFLVTAAQVAAMAPSTNLGAASPVFLGGGTADSTLSHKVMNDAAAFIETLARERGRNAEWDVRAVREAIATSEKDAVQLHVVDYVARDIDDLLRQAQGRTVNVAGKPVTLELAGADVHRITPSWRIQLLSQITDPTVAYVLFNLGSLGLVFELANPGTILPGVAGAICIVLALIAFQTLPVNLGGLVLLVLAMAFFLIELKVHSHGMLAAGGVIAFLAGSLLLFNPSLGPAFRIPFTTVGATTAAMAAFFLFAVGAGVRAQRRKPTTGREGLLGAAGVALSAFDHTHAGQVRVRGEIWQARAVDAARPIAADEAVEVVQLEGLTARVRPLAR